MRQGAGKVARLGEDGGSVSMNAICLLLFDIYIYIYIYMYVEYIVYSICVI